MKEIVTKCELTDRGFTIIAERYQRIAQYGNCGAQLLHKGRAVVYVEDNGNYKTEYLLDKEERKNALKNPDLFLTHAIGEWIDNEDDAQLAFYQWFPEKITHNFWGNEPCRVLVVGSFFGYEPIDWARNEDTDEDIVFSSLALAQDWIDEKEKGPYYLKHGEAGRPEYFIIAC
jgi:hypothetical protein